jgi:hypothetical protein
MCNAAESHDPGCGDGPGTSEHGDPDGDPDADGGPDRGPSVGPRVARKGGVHRLGHVGTVGDPIWDRGPCLFGERLDQAPDRGVLADRDAEPDIGPPADRDHLRGIEATVGPPRELSARARFAAQERPERRGRLDREAEDSRRPGARPRRRFSRHPRGPRGRGSGACRRRSPGPARHRGRGGSRRARATRGGPASVAGRRSPASATRRSSSKAVSRRSRLCDDRIHQVSFLLGLACLITAIFPAQKGTCLRVPTAESARAIGGSGVNGGRVARAGVMPPPIRGSVRPARRGGHVSGALCRANEVPAHVPRLRTRWVHGVRSRRPPNGVCDSTGGLACRRPPLRTSTAIPFGVRLDRADRGPSAWGVRPSRRPNQAAQFRRNRRLVNPPAALESPRARSSASRPLVHRQGSGSDTVGPWPTPSRGSSLTSRAS